MITSRITEDASTTLPLSVREALGLQPGDEIVYEILDGRVVLRKVGEPVTDDPFAAFEEWESEADRRAYAPCSP